MRYTHGVQYTSGARRQFSALWSEQMDLSNNKFPITPNEKGWRGLEH